MIEQIIIYAAMKGIDLLIAYFRRKHERPESNKASQYESVGRELRTISALSEAKQLLKQTAGVKKCILKNKNKEPLN